MTAALVSIIGPPAVGKTTLAERLSEELPARLIREDYAGNPFLAESYSGRDDSRLPAQMYYLLSRVAQLRKVAWPADGLTVSDYGYCQDRIFASARLEPEELVRYEAVAGYLDALVHRPEVIVHLDASEAALLSRMAARGRRFEQGIGAPLLAMLRNAYNDIEPNAPAAVIRVDCDRVDLRDAEPRAELIAKIQAVLRHA